MPKTEVELLRGAIDAVLYELDRSERANSWQLHKIDHPNLTLIRQILTPHGSPPKKE